MLLILYSFIYYFLIVVDGAFFIRMLMSLLTPDAQGSFVGVIIFLTELFIAPIRTLLDKYNLFVDSPLDMSFFLGSVLVNILLLIIILF